MRTEAQSVDSVGLGEMFRPFSGTMPFLCLYPDGPINLTAPQDIVFLGFSSHLIFKLRDLNVQPASKAYQQRGSQSLKLLNHISTLGRWLREHKSHWAESVRDRVQAPLGGKCAEQSSGATGQKV